jgi:hypothetical protein
VRDDRRDGSGAVVAKAYLSGWIGEPTDHPGGSIHLQPARAHLPHARGVSSHVLPHEGRWAVKVAAEPAPVKVSARMPRLRILRWALTAFGVVAVVMVLQAVRSDVPGDALGVLRADPSHPYVGSQLGGEGAYLYAPVVIQVLAPFRDITGFIDAWRAVEGGSLVILAGPFTIPLLFLAPTIIELRLANVNLLLGLAIVAGFRWPGLWSFVLLTKVTPGIGLLWFALRREWRHLAIALGATVVLAAISFALAPTAWFEWFGLLAHEAQNELGPGWAVILPFPLAIRLLAAALLVTWGALTDRRWTVVVSAFVALPATWFTALTMLIGVIPLVGAGWAHQTPTGSAAGGTTPNAA